MGSTDFEIVEGIQQGEVRLISELNRKYFAVLCRYAIYVLGVSEADAGEFANQVLEKAIVSIAQFTSNPKCNLYPWLVTILRNAVTDAWRHKVGTQSGYDVFSFEESNSEADTDGGNGKIASDVLESIVREHLSYGIREDGRKSVIGEAMSRLSVDEQEILLAYINGVTNKEIATFRKSNPNATKTHVNRVFHKFVKEVSTLTGIDEKVIHERWKRVNSKSSAGISNERGASGSREILGKPTSKPPTPR